jgi:hypothetical protein
VSKLVESLLPFAASAVEASEPSLVVRRQDILWYPSSADTLRIEVRVHNVGRSPSARQPMTLRYASFGAFVPWQPLGTLTVPSIPPGESVVVTAEVERSPEPGAGLPGGPPPFTAIGARAKDGQQSSRGKMSSTERAAYRRFRALRRETWKTLRRLGNGRQLHKAGNINVLIGQQEAERHLSGTLQIFPDRRNVAMFLVGDCVDSYRFGINGVDAEWEVSLETPADEDFEMQALAPGTWREMMPRTPAFLVLDTPAAACSAKVEVHVDQESTGRRAVVEFSFDPSARGPSCDRV